MVTQIDRNVLKEVVMEILQENPDALKALIKEVIMEEVSKAPQADNSREALLTGMINEDFRKYGTVFKDLA